jgi:hypothetical protein
MEPNPAAFWQLVHSDVSAELWQWTLEEDPRDEQFDVVLCEGLLGLSGGDNALLLNLLTKKVRRGGVLVITCIDPISDCAEVLRRALAQKYLNASMSLQEQVEALKPVFTPHLATLKGMTRSVEDWILDNILNPASIGPTFSIPEACEALEGRFSLMGCSPRFLLDWRWYKESDNSNQWAIDSYWRNCHNLFDYRKVEVERDAAENRRLMQMCMCVREDVAALERGVVARAIPTHRVEQDPGWFGRGQQYLSFVRVS